MLRLLTQWINTESGELLTPDARIVLSMLPRPLNPSEAVTIQTPFDFDFSRVLAIDNTEDEPGILYPELTLLKYGKELSQLGIKLLAPHGDIPEGSVYPLTGKDLGTILDLWGASPIPLARPSNTSSLIRFGYLTVPLHYYGTDVIDVPIHRQVDFTNQSTVSVIHNLGYKPVVNVFSDTGTLILVSPNHINLNRFDITFNAPVTGYLVY